MSVTRSDNYFEDFKVGDVFHHRRGRTLSQEDNAHWSLATLNTAQAHWNIESMKTYLGGQFDRPILNAAVVLAVAVGLTSQDISENILADAGLDKVRMQRPTFPDDTLTATSTIIGLDETGADRRCGLVTYKIEVRSQHQELVCSFIRSLMIKRRAHWQPLDETYSATHWPRPAA